MGDCKWCFEKYIMSLQKYDVSIAPLNSSCSQKLQYPERTVLFRKSRLQMYLVYLMSYCNCCCEIVKLTESNCSKFTLKSGNVYNCSFKTFTILKDVKELSFLIFLLYLMSICNRSCEIVKSIHSPWKNGISVRAFRHLTEYFSNKNYCSYFCGINKYL